MMNYLYLFLIIFIQFSYANISNIEVEELKLDPKVQQLAEDLMKRQYSYEEAFSKAISEAYHCIYRNKQEISKICLSYGFIR